MLMVEEVQRRLQARSKAPTAEPHFEHAAQDDDAGDGVRDAHQRRVQCRVTFQTTCQPTKQASTNTVGGKSAGGAKQSDDQNAAAIAKSAVTCALGLIDVVVSTLGFFGDGLCGSRSRFFC